VTQVEVAAFPVLFLARTSAPASNCSELCTAEGSLSVLGVKVRLAKVCELITLAVTTTHPFTEFPYSTKFIQLTRI
jgi:hypothetical protein